ncbi:DUF125-domain-containing protein [Gonapodya prolifera JEL478]|uniref:DUF125-domain-containing protein n=1 Tax=Gonapodya prolifera (strain JEL478) TaxID=1344416 RepID=A0A139AHP2_GONPJ|nr:DUF125-domain-containing protein [Gonapodya prolifera JEL478]|eukprot:KXS16209.1 DUF125-domain-containing protein [Gonapodya prolifera JEL478]
MPRSVSRSNSDSESSLLLPDDSHASASSRQSTLADELEKGLARYGGEGYGTMAKEGAAVAVEIDAEPGHEHYSHRAPWLRAAMLGACDGLVSVSSLMVGVIAGGGSNYQVVLSGIAGTVAGAMSMGAGEYVSVWSMRDAELADVHRERTEFLRAGPHPYHSEMRELAQIYESRGFPPDLAREVAEHFHHNHDLDQLVAIHARDELGIDTDDLADPLGATLASMASFGMGALLPLLTGSFLTDPDFQIGAVIFITVIGLFLFGAAGAVLGGAPPGRAAFRMMVGGSIAMAATWGVGKIFGVVAG